MSDRAQRITLWILAVLLVTGTSLALRYARGYRPLAGLPASSAFPPNVNLRFEDIRVVGRSKGRPAWVLTAGRVETTRSRSRIEFADGVGATLLQNGRPAANLSAPTASYDTVSRSLRLWGSIVCHVRNLRVSTPVLFWDAGSNLVRCPGLVRITHARGDVRGEQLTVDIRGHEYTLRNVHAEFDVDPFGD